VITAHTDIVASVEFSAALTDQNVASNNCLTTEFFNA
jgi:hypothetical protein